MNKITLLNTSILTSYGTFEYTPISLENARKLVANGETMSAIGHAATAEILSDLLKIEVKPNRIEYLQGIGENALVFKLNVRISEGKVLNRKEIETIGYEFGLLSRIR